jgi:hypothetical protein
VTASILTALSFGMWWVFGIGYAKPVARHLAGPSAIFLFSPPEVSICQRFRGS